MTGPGSDGLAAAELAATLWATVPRLLAHHRYLVLGTADPGGTPWVTPVFHAPDGTHRVVWVSGPDSRHSRNIAARPQVAITVFDTAAPIGRAEALYLEATAGLVPDAEQPAASTSSTPVSRPASTSARTTSDRPVRCGPTRPPS